MTTTMKTRILTTLLALASALTLAACGSDGSSSTSGSSASTLGNPADRAFVAAMVPHHQMAIKMAKMAEDSAEHSEIKALAGDIIEAQQSEISKLEATDAKLARAGIEKGDLGVPESGMDMKMADLENADPFDKTFIDMMVPHHKGAITMARAELSKGKNPTLRRMAEAIISAQQGEVNRMRKWRKQWYGAAMDDSMDTGH